MTRIAELKERLRQTQAQLDTTEMAALLALTTTPDLRERVKDPTNGYYWIEAYGLTRADGGYVLVRFRCKGQRESIAFYSADTFHGMVTGRLMDSQGCGWPLFLDAASKIRMRQYDLLHPKPGPELEQISPQVV